MNEVQHLVKDHKFVINRDGGEAVLAYRLSGQGDKASVNFYSTYVPPDLRGKGLAEKLVRSGLHWAREQGFHIEASCWYVAKFLR